MRNRDSHALACVFFALWPESSGNLPLVMFCGLLCIFFFFAPFFLYFVVLSYWGEDVNNVLACESRRMSLGKRMLLHMHWIESV
jgi:hypothetical protein